ncbi:hypothetical protein L3V82_10905 [Thiotrichales bacterium 19S3-7]|nr:hypothetical protein [Thiotrichales bacterium 19S3-7]MCF6802689.1 hypothetical protein [Thiotrichales bacterium 19S3-11]
MTFDLTIDISETDQWQEDQEDFGVAYFHGSNSTCLASVAKYGLLTMKQLNKKGILLNSGERGYTLHDLNQPISNGVSLYSSSRYYMCKHYATKGCNDHIYPVVYGISNDMIELKKKVYEHPLTIGSINVDSILAVYVPESFVATAKQDLQLAGFSKLVEVSAFPGLEKAYCDHLAQNKSQSFLFYSNEETSPLKSWPCAFL